MHLERPGTLTINVFIIVPAAVTACRLHEVIDTRFRRSSLPTRAIQAPGMEIKKVNKTIHLGTFLALAARATRINVRIRYEEARSPEGPPLEVAGNLYVYLIPSIFKEGCGPDREEHPRGPPLPAGSCYEDEQSRSEISRV